MWSCWFLSAVVRQKLFVTQRRRGTVFLCVPLRKPLRPLRLKSSFRNNKKAARNRAALRDLCMYDYVNPYHKMKTAHSTAYNNNTRTRSLPRSEERRVGKNV